MKKILQAATFLLLSSFSTTSLYSQEYIDFPSFVDTFFIDFPDPFFKTSLLANSQINTNGDGEISVSEAENYSGAINLGPAVNPDGFPNPDFIEPHLSIRDITGVEYFKNLGALIIRPEIQLDSVDLTNNTELVFLILDGNGINEIKLPSVTPKLQAIGLRNNNITNINISNRQVLGSLVLINTNIESIEGSNDFLFQLRIQENNLNTLDLTKMPNLRNAKLSNNKIEHIDISGTDIGCLNLANNELKSLNIANSLFDDYEDFELDVTGNPDLTCIQINEGMEPYVDQFLRDSTASFTIGSCNPYVIFNDDNFKSRLLSNSEINTDGDEEISFVEAAAYEGKLSVRYRHIEDLTGIEAFINIQELDCRGNKLTSLDLSTNTQLEKLNCGRNKLTSLTLGNNTTLERIYCDVNKLTNLDLSNIPSLVKLNCYRNKLESLDLSNNPALENLNCNINELTSLNLANGNNENITRMWSNFNFDLNCIQIDEGFTPPFYWQYDYWFASYSTNCNEQATSNNGIGNNIPTHRRHFDQDITIYPNPANIVLNVVVKDIEDYTVSLYNTLGQKVIETTDSVINVENVSPGMYILQIADIEGKIIKNESVVIGEK